MAGEVLDWPASPETIDFPLDFLDFPCFSIGSARGPEMWEPIGGLPHIRAGPQKKIFERDSSQRRFLSDLE